MDDHCFNPIAFNEMTFITRAIMLITNWRKKMFTRHNANSLGELARKATQAAQVHGTDCEVKLTDSYDTIEIIKNEKVVGEIVLTVEE